MSFHHASIQSDRYHQFYRQSLFQKLRRLVRFDVRYRVNRLRELLQQFPLDHGAKVLEVGFGGGQLLESLPRDIHIVGAEVSSSAVDNAKKNPVFHEFLSARFLEIPETDPEAIARGPFDLIISSHTLEHVPNDSDTLVSWLRRLRPNGRLILFVPIEEPDYIPYHLRNYSMQSIQEVVRRAGFQLELVEPSMHINGHLWRVLTIPSRRGWPLVKPIVDATRLATLSLFPYKTTRRMERSLHTLGVGPRQALIVARRKEAHRATETEPRSNARCLGV